MESTQKPSQASPDISKQAPPSKKSCISDFHTKYKIKGKKPSKSEADKHSDMETHSSSEEEDFIYRMDFDSKKGYNSKDLTYRKTAGMKSDGLFESLSAISKLRLQKFEEDSLNQEELQTLRVFQGEPILEFDDYLNLNKYNLPITRNGSNSVYANFENENIFIFNNLKTVVSLTFDIKTLNYLIKTIYIPKQDEFISFVNIGNGNFKNIVFIGEMAKRKITFFDLSGNQKLFSVSLDDFEEPMLNAINKGKSLYVSFLDCSIAEVDIENDNVLRVVKFENDSGVEIITDIKLLGEDLIVATNMGIFKLGEEGFEMIFNGEDPEKPLSEEDKQGLGKFYFLSKREQADRMLVTRENSNTLYLVHLTTKKIICSLNFDQRGARIKDISANPQFTEFGALLEYTGTDSSQRRIISLGYIKADSLKDFDLLKVSPAAKTVRFIAKINYLLTEGSGKFSVFETKNDFLTVKIQDKIQEHLESPERNGNSHPPFKEDSKLIAENSGQNSANIRE